MALYNGLIYSLGHIEYETQYLYRCTLCNACIRVNY